jgi:cytochrome c-type biogenesis protein
MPDIPLTLINGEETTFWQLAEKGKPVVINSFASWCPPCKKEMPDFIEASEKYKGEVTFIFFDSFDGERETKEALDAFAKKYFNDDTICVIDPGYISALFQSNSLPTTILLDREGVPVNGFQGMVSKDVLINAIDQLLE